MIWSEGLVSIKDINTKGLLRIGIIVNTVFITKNSTIINPLLMKKTG